MKGVYIGYHNQPFSFNAEIALTVPQSGFALKFGQTGSPFYSNVSFSGISGYLFDKSGVFFGGYQKNVPFRISGDFFFNDASPRYAYYYNDVLVANNIYGGTGFIDAVIFEDYGSNSSCRIDFTKAGGSPIILADNTGIYLVSSEGYFLSANGE